MQMIHYEDLIIEASGSYLCEELPDKYYKLDAADLDDFLEDRACENYEFKTAGELWELISCTADGLKSFLRMKGIHVRPFSHGNVPEDMTPEEWSQHCTEHAAAEMACEIDAGILSKMVAGD